MPRIRCHYIDCIYLDDGYCGAAGVEIDPDLGCMTYKIADDIAIQNDWDDDDGLDDWDELDLDDEDDDLWLDVEDDY